MDNILKPLTTIALSAFCNSVFFNATKLLSKPLVTVGENLTEGVKSNFNLLSIIQLTSAISSFVLTCIHIEEQLNAQYNIKVTDNVFLQNLITSGVISGIFMGGYDLYESNGDFKNYWQKSICGNVLAINTSYESLYAKFFTVNLFAQVLCAKFIADVESTNDFELWLGGADDVPQHENNEIL